MHRLRYGELDMDGRCGAAEVGDVALVFVAVEDIDVVIFHGQSSAENAGYLGC